MRLYVWDKMNQGKRTKVFLDIEASTRWELKNRLRSFHFTLNGVSYNVNEVMAESGTNSTSTGAVLGGVIGLFGGPWGVAIGAAAGGLLGNQEDSRDNEKVRRFNKSNSNGWKEQIRH